MKKIFLLTLCFLAFSFTCFADKFVLIPVNETHKLESLFENKDLKIHYYCNDFILATTTEIANIKNVTILDEKAFGNVGSYIIVYCLEANKNEYLTRIAGSAETLYSGENFLIMKVLSTDFIPAKNDRISLITDTEVSLPKSVFNFPEVTEIDPFIQSLIEKVNTDTLMAYVQHLQDYGTRAYNEPQAYQAQDWIKTKFEIWNLDVEIQNVTIVPWEYWSYYFYPHVNSSGNVIAVQTGTKYPDEYIVCGAHYDSWSWDPVSQYIAPGADDNATGTAGILEIARILSQYEFERSIIYCTFAAEEFGLWGSKAYASRCSQQGMNILGYFNIDMSGYLAPNATQITISIIRNPMANPLANYYTNVTNTYFPEVNITHHSMMTGGDSDHTSFVNNGYQGIYPFENNDAYNPSIHTPYDIIGPNGVNNPEQVRVFTSASLAGIATLAVLIEDTPPLASPTNCVAINFFERQIKITWDAPEENTPDGYYVYRDSVKIFEEPITTNEFFDTPELAGEYCYNVTAVYGELESEFSNTSCAQSYNNVNEYSSRFKIYPNPARNELRITNYQLRNGVIEIFDVNGKKHTAGSRTQNAEDEIVLNISHLSPGIYFVKISNEMAGKFIKE